MTEVKLKLKGTYYEMIVILQFELISYLFSLEIEPRQHTNGTSPDPLYFVFFSPAFLFQRTNLFTAGTNLNYEGRTWFQGDKHVDLK